MTPQEKELIELSLNNGNVMAARGLIALLNGDFDASRHEPDPAPGQTDIGQLVLIDIQARIDAGYEKYGTKLQSHNGRNALIDAYQEAIDLCMHLRQAIEEQKTDGANN